MDKIFALCDYYLGGNETRNSRHIYDIAKLITRIDLTKPEIKDLIADVKSDRKLHKNCLSAQDGQNVSELLEQIVEMDFYKRDYEAVTSRLLAKPMSYKEAIQSLTVVANSGLF